MSIDAHLVKRFSAAADSEAFQLDVRLIASSGVTVLFGPSGSGKTLTLDCIAGFTTPDAGRILVNDQLYFDAASQLDVPPQLRHCGYVFQDHALFPHMTVRQNLRFAASVARDRRPALMQRRRINELLDAFELSDLAARKPAQLSGGQKQRAALARVLVGEPKILLFDEPTRGLDARLRRAFYDILQKTRERLPLPILLVTHDLEECFELADYVCLMEKGRFLQTGPRDQVLCEPATADAARFLGIYCVVPAEIKALDPGRDTSSMAFHDQRIEGRYLRGHLIGDRGLLCLRESEIDVLPPSGQLSASEVMLAVNFTNPAPRGVRIHFVGGVSALVSETEFQRLRGFAHLRLNIPAAAISFVTG